MGSPETRLHIGSYTLGATVYMGSPATHWELQYMGSPETRLHIGSYSPLRPGYSTWGPLLHIGSYMGSPETRLHTGSYTGCSKDIFTLSRVVCSPKYTETRAYTTHTLKEKTFMIPGYEMNPRP